MAKPIESIVYVVDQNGNVGLPVSDGRIFVLRPAEDGYDALAVNDLSDKYAHVLVELLSGRERLEVIVPVGFPGEKFSSKSHARTASEEINAISNKARVN